MTNLELVISSPLSRKNYSTHWGSCDQYSRLKSNAILQCARLEGLHSRSNSLIGICSDSQAADMLAKKASHTHYIGPEPVLGVSSTTEKNALRQWSVLEQYKLCCITTGCRQAKQMLGNMNFCLSKYTLNL